MMRFLYLLFILPTLLMADAPEPVKWSFSYNKISDGVYDLIYTASIEEGWNVYSQFIDEGGPVPTMITYEDLGGATLDGDATEAGHRKEGIDPIFEMQVIKFLSDEDFVITQRIKTSDIEKSISGYLTFMCCNDEKCLPPSDVDFSYNFSSEDRAAIQQSQPSPTSTDVINLVDRSPVQWSFAIEEGEDDTYYLVYTSNIKEGWTVYSQFLDEGGPIPTMIIYEDEDNIELIGKGVESGHKKEGHDAIFEMQVVKFLADEPYVIRQQVRLKDVTKPVKGFLTFMTCDDEQCLPPTDVDFVLSPSGDHDVAATEDSKPVLTGDNVIDQVRPRLKETYAAPLADCGETNTQSTNLWWMFIFGFGGGLLALLTPCVFPMIPLTVSFFTKDTKRKGWVNALLYGLSIIVIYVTMGLLITGLFGADALNSLSTNWIANTLFFIIFIAFAISFFGYYEIQLPSSWANKSDQMADKGGLIGIFFMAFTLALVSFSCTGPIIGTALVQSATSQAGPLVVMLGFSIALALPFGLFAAFPAFLNSLPKSGGWMTSVKVVLGFIEVALAFKFLSVADLTSHWGILKYEVFIGIWIAVALGMAGYGFGWIKFPHDGPLKKISPRRWVFSLGSLALAGYLATGFMYNDTVQSYNSPKLLSGIAPPSNYNIFLDPPSIDASIKDKYPSYSKCANNIDCFKDYDEGMAFAKEKGKPVLLDHTGHGCVNCRKTEEYIWIDDRVRSKLNDDFVLISLYVDDREPLDEVLISKSRQKKLRNIGNKWSDFQIVNFDQASQPLYVMLTPNEEVMSIPRGYKEGVDGYLNYLECGLETWKAVSVR